MNAEITGKGNPATKAMPTRKRPRGEVVIAERSTSAAWISPRMRLHLSRNTSPSDVSLTVRVLRWKSLTPTRSSSLEMLLLTADADIPIFRPVATKLWLCAVSTKISRPLNVSKTTSRLVTVLSSVLCTLPALIQTGQRHTMVNTRWLFLHLTVCSCRLNRRPF